jgi:hypothetical protein
MARCGFPWKKTTKRPVVPVYTNCETALMSQPSFFDLVFGTPCTKPICGGSSVSRAPRIGPYSTLAYWTVSLQRVQYEAQISATAHSTVLTWATYSAGRSPAHLRHSAA